MNFLQTVRCCCFYWSTRFSLVHSPIGLENVIVRFYTNFLSSCCWSAAIKLTQKGTYQRYYANLIYNRKNTYNTFSFWIYGCVYWTCFDGLSFVFPRLTWSTSFTRANWRTMCAVWSVAMRAGGLTHTWTSLWSSGPSGPARLLAAWCVQPSLWPFICSCGLGDAALRH